MTDITLIPLNKLAPSADNVRKTATAQGIAEMAASIKAHGLQQNLVVKKNGKTFGIFKVSSTDKAMRLLGGWPSGPTPKRRGERRPVRDHRSYHPTANSR